MTDVGQVGVTTGVDAPSARAARRWDVVRVVLVVWWVAVVAASVPFATREASVEDLLAAVDAGAVGEVAVYGGVAPGSTGTALQEARWRDGPFRFATEVVHEVPEDVAADPVTWSEEGQPLRTVRVPLERQVADVAPDVVVRTAPYPTESFGGALHVPSVVSPDGVAVSVATWRLTGVLAVLVAVGWLAHLWVLVNGPAPRTGTRWGWFWLMWLPPVGPLVHALIAARRAGDPPHDPSLPVRARGPVTGGWGFLLLVVLGGVLA